MIREYNRTMLRSAFVSLFWSLISDLKAKKNFKLKSLSDDLRVDKSAVSRWFSGFHPNWTLNSIADIATALNVSLEIKAVDKATGIAFTPLGLQASITNPADPPIATADEDDLLDDKVEWDRVQDAAVKIESFSRRAYAHAA